MAGSSDSNNEWDEKSDLTRLEDLSDFLHEDDPSLDAKLQELSDEPDSDEDLAPSSAVNLSDLEDQTQENYPLPDNENPLVENKDEAEEENTFEQETSEEEEDPYEQETFEEEEDTYEQETSKEEEEDTYEEDFPAEQNSFEESPLEEESFKSNQGDLSNNSYEDDKDSFEDSEDLYDDDDDDLRTEETETLNLQPESHEFTEEQSLYDENDESHSNKEDESLNESTVQDEDYEQTENAAESNQKVDNFNDQNEQQSIDQNREDFQDLRDFADALTYGVVQTGGNPPFSLIVRNIKTLEDAEDIKIILNEHGLITPDTEKSIEQAIEQGHLLISQISEYAAIYLAHKMRRFDIEMRIGLSEQLHPSKSYNREGRGLYSKSNITQNKEESNEMKSTPFEVDSIKLTTASNFAGHSIKEYKQIISSHSLIDEDELARLHQISDFSNEDNGISEVLEEILDEFPENEEYIHLGLNEIYRKLADDLKNEAFKIKANAIIGIIYNITPIVFQKKSQQVHYKITCTGNAVWIVDNY